MKTAFAGKGIMALIFTFLCSFAVSAVTPKDYLYDTKEENGKIVSKVVYLQEDGMLNKQVRYEFQYNRARYQRRQLTVGMVPKMSGLLSTKSIINMLRMARLRRIMVCGTLRRKPTR